MRHKRLPFPRYLNRPRLWLLFEEDELIFALLLMGIYIFITFIVLNASPFVIVLGAALVFYYSIQIFRKIQKSSTRNTLNFYLYELGIYKPKKKKKNDIDVPEGFIKRFID